MKFTEHIITTAIRSGLIGASLVCALVFSALGASAQILPLSNPLSVSVRVESKLEPKKAIGLVLSANNSLEIADTTIEKIGDKLFSVSFIVDRNMVRRDSVATAMAFDENGEVVFASVSPELLSEAQTLLAKIPECPIDGSSATIRPEQLGPLQQLVQVRTERVEIARQKIGRILDQPFLKKLEQFEEAFGLTSEATLSADLPPEVLVDRLSRISHAVKKYRMFRQPRRDAPEEAAPDAETTEPQ